MLSALDPKFVAALIDLDLAVELMDAEHDDPDPSPGEPRVRTYADVVRIAATEPVALKMARVAQVRFIKSLSADARRELLAVFWMGRRDYDPSHQGWVAAIENAKGSDHEGGTGPYLAGKLNLWRILRDGMIRIGLGEAVVATDVLAKADALARTAKVDIEFVQEAGRFHGHAVDVEGAPGQGDRYEDCEKEIRLSVLAVEAARLDDDIRFVREK